MTSLRHGSLFSGYGGIDIAIADVFGAETVWVSDIEPGPCKVLAHRYPDVPNLGDITRIDWQAVAANPDLGVDLISGGSPCQDISTAGRGAGMVAGTRSNLWVEMREAIRVLRPMFVVWENVGAARSARAASRFHPDHIDRAIDHHLTVKETSRDPEVKERHRRAAHRLMEQRARRLGVPYPKPSLRALGRVLGDLASLGFDAEVVALPASGVGAPHRRLRYFVLAADARGREWLAAHAALADSNIESGVERRLAATGEAPRGRALGDVAGRDRAPVTLLPTPTTQDGANTGGPSTFGRNTLPLNAVVTLIPTPRATRGGSSTETVALLPTPRATDGDKGGPNQRGSSGDLMLPSAVCQLLPTPTVATEQAWGPYAAAISRWEAINGPAPNPTTRGKKGNPKLNPAFALWMMGVPAGWVTDVPDITDNEALRLAGNGVCPPQAVAALRLCAARMAVAESLGGAA